MTFIQRVKNEISENRNRTKESENEVRQYVSDVFLNAANGTIARGYQIDFSFDNLEAAQGFCEILAAYDILPKLTHRGSLIVVYIKSREDICNLLALIGATKALMELSNEIALRDLRGNVNRRANCDAGNIAKLVTTAKQQVDAMRKLNLDALEPRLREVAAARLEYPEASYEELAKLLGLTKSGLVHRLKKILLTY